MKTLGIQQSIIICTYFIISIARAMKLMLEMPNDLIVVSESLHFGFVLSEDELCSIKIK
ncbi:hypothetical protein [Paenibacillus sp. GSMTC-2017]|uniref:hypothetical protein n=1 Tax=Paenibacillus sp. GSMTC-2017 TaxID=2794350 RepID=UPI001E440373|nr:hypothetical protein [Paenibacillus sp. GSMTC-2017]